MLIKSNIKEAFVYIKTKDDNKRVYPDDKHAFSFKNIKKLNDIIFESIKLLGSKTKRNKYIKTINEKKISF